jgi:hypothetical protein
MTKNVSKFLLTAALSFAGLVPAVGKTATRTIAAAACSVDTSSMP